MGPSDFSDHIRRELPEEHSMLHVLHELGKLSEADDKELRRAKVSVVDHGGRRYSLRKADTKGRISRLFRRRGPKQNVDDLKSLKKFLEGSASKLEETMREMPELRGYYAKVVSRAMNGLKRLYEVHRGSDSVESSAYKSDILEAISVATRTSTPTRRSLNAILKIKVSRVAANPIAHIGGSFNKHHIPLFTMENLEEVVAIMEREFPDRAPTLKEINRHPELSKFLEREETSCGYMVDASYRHPALRAIHSEFVGE